MSDKKIKGMGVGLIFVIIFLLSYQPLSALWHNHLNRFAVKYYIANLSDFNARKLQNISQGSVLFYGDSLMQGLAVQAVTEGAVNLGVGHANASFVEQQIRGYHQLQSASAVVVAVGINDVLRGYPDAVVDGYLAIMDVVPDNIPLIISLLAPVDATVLGRQGTAETIDDVNSQLLMLCKQRSSVYCLSMREEFSGGNGSLQARFHVGDGLHLSAKANALWIRDLNILLSEVVSGTGK